LESGSKPYAIREKDGPWILRNRSAIKEEYHFKGGFVTKEMQETGWTFDEWIKRSEPEINYDHVDHPVWPLSTVNSNGKIFVSKDVMITPGKLATDAPDQAVLNFKANAKNLVDGNCMQDGIILGRSTAFITAVMCEMLRAYTVASTRSCIETFNVNKVMHFACLFSFIATVSLTIIPGVKTIFKLDTPYWWVYLVSFIFAFGCMLNDEIFKFFFRQRVKGRKKSQLDSVKQDEQINRLNMISDMIHDLESSKTKTEGDVFELKESLGHLLKNVNKCSEGISALESGAKQKIIRQLGQDEV
jgi:hypothetical protein